MNSFHIIQSRIITLNLPKEYDLNKIQIGVLATEKNKNLLKINSLGETVLPSGVFGRVCYKNAYGEIVLDKSQPKERRCVSTNLIYPYGNTNASPVFSDVYRMCWVQKIIPPKCVELSLLIGNDKKEYILANLTPELRKNDLKHVINIFLEIFGECYIFNECVEINNQKRYRCHWEILPTGTKPSEHLNEMFNQNKKILNKFFISRLQFLEKYRVNKIVEGINGFKGYFAYVFDNYCFLESAFYGNATYIISAKDWETLSKKTKSELMSTNKIKDKIIHTKNWFTNIERKIKELENQ